MTSLGIAGREPRPDHIASALSQAERAAEVAWAAYRDRRDIVGRPYLEHATRVAESFDRIEQSIEHCSAWLHAAMQDTDLISQDLADAGIRPEIIEVVELLTRRPQVPAADYYEAIKWHPSARAVKLAVIAEIADIAGGAAKSGSGHLDAEARERLNRKHRVARIALGLAG